MLLRMLFTSLFLLAYASAQECRTNEWQCTDGTCINKSQRCDNKPSCPYDSSDEENCGLSVACSPRDFVCDNGKCWSPSVRCNGVFDCADMTDELDCKNVCLPGNFLCNDSNCIPEEKRCDNHKDCSDDELHCVGCPANEFQCADKTCLPSRMRCNGYPECKDKSDEVNCPPEKCTKMEFQCTDYTCVPIQKHCDGHADCVDQSDEENCLIKDALSATESIRVSSNLSVRHMPLFFTGFFIMCVHIFN